MNTRHPLSHSTASEAAEVVGRQLNAGVQAWAELARAVAAPELMQQVQLAGEAVVQALAAGNQLLVAGNGGSAAVASHVAGEFIGKCILDRAPLPAVNLAESLSSLTAIGNDYGYEHVFTRGVAAHGRSGDVLLAMSTSGRSANVVGAIEHARAIGITTIAMVGAGGAHLDGSVDHLLVVPSLDVPRIQEVHMLWAHTWCEAVDMLSQPDSATRAHQG